MLFMVNSTEVTDYCLPERDSRLTVVPIIRDDTRPGGTWALASNALMALSMPTVTSAPVAALWDATTASAPDAAQLRSTASVLVPALDQRSADFIHGIDLIEHVK